MTAYVTRLMARLDRQVDKFAHVGGGAIVAWLALHVGEHFGAPHAYLLAALAVALVAAVREWHGSRYGKPVSVADFLATMLGWAIVATT